MMEIMLERKKMSGEITGIRNRTIGNIQAFFREQRELR